MAELLDHEYDGIQEYDNPIPGWLAQLFFATILFGIAYAIYYPSFWFYNGVSAWSSSGQYQQQVEREETRYAPLQAEAEKKALAALESLTSDEATLAAGQQVYSVRCTPCHGADAGGKIGPSLKDEEWLYGGDAKSVLTSIREGRPKGMPPWKMELNKEEIQQVTAFVLSLSPNPEETTEEEASEVETPIEEPTDDQTETGEEQ